MPKKKAARKLSLRSAVANPAAARAAKTKPPTPDHPAEAPAGHDVFMVGLGASAGGLEALEEFFTHMPADSGMAFVVVTHLHPGHVSLLPELLAKRARMLVVQAAAAQRVEPNHIYVAGAEGYLAILNGQLQVMPFKDFSGVRLPIDYFFRSLAEDQKERAVGIVLSGTATDGTLGLKAIKGAGGMAMAQDPESAKQTGMPASAIATGLVDYVLPPGQMPARLMAYAKGPYVAPLEPGLASDAALPEPMQKMILLLRSRTGHDFSAYKPNTIRRRSERRMNVHQMKGPEQYVRFLHDNPHELDLLFKELLIGATSFFRDPEAFESLAGTVLPELLKNKPDDAVVRVWVPGCSTGEEAYSLAILLQQCADRLKKPLHLQIFATDLDTEAIEAARSGHYPDGIAVDVSHERLTRYFLKEDGNYRVRKELRERVIFAPQNVIKDPPFTKLDLISCRNLLIYLKADTQKQLLGLFHYALKPRGVLLLGPSESIGEPADHFEVRDKRWKIFLRRETAATYQPVTRGHTAAAPMETGGLKSVSLLEQPRLSNILSSNAGSCASSRNSCNKSRNRCRFTSSSAASTSSIR